ncbi:hypothetical protein [Dyella psychrodurans]|uniref:Uncharacterized protein n=1 Tax=Dyella psychrodurans TaxID=1927960 RepID=A0A370X7H0_9GAMM|nr:hypothetical protein [Dyella psychrodurans]RDS84262.1 hypothetical protein DWU99_11000 [Dyella psychrodurans]
MQLSFLHARTPMHTPDRLLNVYVACRTAKPSSPGLVMTLLRASARWCRGLARSRKAHNA